MDTGVWREMEPRRGAPGGTRANAAVHDRALAPGRDYWMAIVIGYLAAVLTSVGVTLAVIRHGW